MVTMNYRKYREMIMSDTKTPMNIMSCVDAPSFLYKYRCVLRHTDGKAVEDPYWREAIEGVCYFSLAKDFNRNDPNDCVLYYTERKIREAIYESCSYKGKSDRFLDGKVDEIMQEYINSIRDNFRIGCFTKNHPSERCMWETEDFGGNHTGFCIEYKTTRNILYPGTMILLPVLYERNTYDSTPVICSLVKNKGININQLEIVSLSYNFALIKLKKYMNEHEWRLLIVKNRYDEYFDEPNTYKKDLSCLINAIYLGRDFCKMDHDETKLSYIKGVCQRKKIPLYMMKENGGILSPVAIQKSEIEALSLVR